MEAEEDIGREGEEDMEMRERDREASEREERDRSDDDTRRRSDTLRMDRNGRMIFNRVDADADGVDLDEESRINGMRRSGLEMEMESRSIHNKKQFLEDAIGITVNRGDGPASRSLYDGLLISRDMESGEIDGARYKGKKIINLTDSGEMRYSTDADTRAYADEFDTLLKEADAEHLNTPAAVAERSTGVSLSEDSIRGITDRVRGKIVTRIDNVSDTIKSSTDITDNELREFRGLLDVKGETVEAKIEALKIESKNWRDKADAEGDTAKGKLYEAISEVADLKADELRLTLNMKPETKEVTDMLEKTAEASDMTRYERFKSWARSNLLVLSSLAIGVAGIVTTAVMAVRNAGDKGGDALDKLAKAIVKKAKELAKKLGENIGPVVTAIGTIISGIITILAKLLGFLGENLWLLFLAVTYFVYSEYKSRRETSAYRQTQRQQ